MKPLDKYRQLKELCAGKKHNENALSQYLHIVQVMKREEEAWNRHREYMNQWLRNIEKTIRDSIKEEELCEITEQKQ